MVCNLALVLAVSTIGGSAAKYYVEARSGDDTRDRTVPSAAYRSPEKGVLARPPEREHPGRRHRAVLHALRCPSTGPAATAAMKLSLWPTRLPSAPGPSNAPRLHRRFSSLQKPS